MHTNIWSENVKEIDHLEKLVVDGRIILKYNLKKSAWKVWTGFVWLRIGTSI
jgi:hypothetical protein